ncbi:porin [Shewanella youngdeokensis]|uniref:Porin n=1 Tax=Shewanella youngdeokensis TaxID=2999068 RepID=A0ABZ0JXW3_9GAMM|nr:porin [Shewanella sp. DAU334]
MLLSHKYTLVLLSLGVVANAQAAIELTDNVFLSGFGTTSISKTDNTTPLFINREITDETCYDCDTLFGLQLDANIFDGLKASAQVVKRTQDDWSDPELEWAYLSYEFNDFEVRAGRLRLPVFMISEFYFVGQAYVWARPPVEVYDAILGTTSYDGVSFAWNYELSDELLLTVSPYYGFERTTKVALGSTIFHFESDYTTGIYLDLTGFNYRIHAGFLQSKYILLPATKPDKLSVYTVGAEYSMDAWQFMAEVEYDDLQTNWYASVAYAFDGFTPYIVYGESHDLRESKGVTVGARYDVTPAISVNAEYQTLTSEDPFNRAQFVAPPIYFGEKEDVDLFSITINFVF